MTTPSLSTLLAIESQETVEERILDALQESSFPVTDWEDGGIAKTLVSIESAENASFSAQQVIVARAGFLSTAAQAGNDWLTLHAQERYQTTRYPATRTVGRVSLYCASGSGPHTITAGQLRFADSAGHRYTNTSTGTLTSGGNLDLTIEAESVGSEWNVSNGAITTLETPLAGVTFAQVTGVVATGTTPPTVSITKTSTIGFQVNLWIKIIAGGPRGTATFQWSDSGGSAWSATTATAATVNIGSGLDIVFATGTYSTDNRWYCYLEATSYNPGPGGSWITVSGTDEESNARLQERCRNKWATLGYGQNADWFEYYATTDHVYEAEVSRSKIETMAPYTNAAKYTASTPALTISGAPTTAALTKFVAEITTGGARGVAVFKWSDDDGGTYTTGVTTGASCTLGSTGCTISFEDTTYTTGQKWRWSGCYGGVLVTIATASGGASATIVDEVQASFAAKTSATVLVESAIEESVNITCDVIAATEIQATFVADAQNAVAALFSERDIGAPLYLAQVVAAIMALSGVTNVSIASPSSTVQCGPRSVLTLGTLTLNVSWV